MAVLLIFFSHESDTGVPGRGRKWPCDWGKGNEVEVTAKDYGRNASGDTRHLGNYPRDKINSQAAQKQSQTTIVYLLLPVGVPSQVLLFEGPRNDD